MAFYNLEIVAVWTSGSSPDHMMPSYILYGIGFLIKYRNVTNRYMAFAAGYDNKFAIGWAESTDDIRWRQIQVV